jgi:hypothetical protein
MQRDIKDILNFRVDISPFLAHLTKNDESSNAKDKLIHILDKKKLIRGKTAVSAMRFAEGCYYEDPETIQKYLSAICFTETPISEIHTMLEIEGRQVDLQPYGLILMKDRLKNKGVSPVLYLNTYFGKQDITKLVDLMWKSKDTDDEYREYTKMLFPLISCFGMKLRSEETDEFIVDFYWEREWRFCMSSELAITDEDIFMGLCLDSEIQWFEGKYDYIKFIDPRRNVKWYAKKLVKTRNDKGITQSVV